MPNWKSCIRERMHLKGLPGEGLDRSGPGRDYRGSERIRPEPGSPEAKRARGKGRFTALLSDLPNDLLYGFRMLKKNPGFTAVALITLALGIGVNTSLFSLFEAWHRLPNRLEEPDTLAFLWYRSPRYDRSFLRIRDYLACRDQAESFAQTGVFVSRDRIFSGAGEPERVSAVEVSAALWPMLGFEARAGRLQSAEEDSPAKSGVVILTDKFWRRKFNGDPDVLGRTVLLDDKSHTIIGIMPPQVEMEEMWYNAEVFVPFSVEAAVVEGESQDYGDVMVRIKPGATFEKAKAELRLISARLAQDYPETNKELEIWIQPLKEKFLPADDRLLMLIFLAAVAAVLVIACVNVANMLLAKASMRVREFSVRMALGARRGRLVRQLLAESLMLAFGGGLLGILAARWALDLFAGSIEFMPFLQGELDLNLAVLGYAFLVSLAAALVFGMAPIFFTSRISPMGTLKTGGQAASAGPSQHRMRNALIIGQLAIGLPLIICSGLALRHVQTLRSADSIGFDPDRLLSFSVELPRYRYTGEEQRANFYRDMLENIEAAPGIESAGAISKLPIGTAARLSGKITIEGRAEPEKDFYGYHVASAGVFRTLEVRLAGGRLFTEQDRAAGAPVAIMNRRAAMRYWPDGDAVGKRVKLDGPAYAERWVTIVGVVTDFGCDVFGEPFPPALYVPLGQNPYATMDVIARTHYDPVTAMESVRKIVHGMDPGIPINDLSAAGDLVHRWLRDDRWLAYFLGGLAALVLGLASIGLFGIMSYTVAQRTGEIGVRLALGAERRDILRLVIRRCLKLTAIGTVAGILISIPIGMLMASSLRGVTGLDPLTYGGVVLLLFAVSLAAGILPAHRATKIDPVLALRCE